MNISALHCAPGTVAQFFVVEALFDSSTPKKIPYETGTVHRHFVGKCLSFTLQKVNVKLPYNRLNEKL